MLEASALRVIYLAARAACAHERLSEPLASAETAARTPPPKGRVRRLR